MQYHYNLKGFFKEISNKCAQNVAINEENRSYTYADLDKKSDELAAFMQQHKASQGSIIAIISTKAFEDYALMIACLKIGAGYTNIDIDDPAQRIKNIFERCKPHMVFSGVGSTKIEEICRDTNIPFENYSNIHCRGKAPKDGDIDGETIAYIMFTSGSTGVPKGVAITHQNIIHFIAWSTKRYKIRETDNFANISPMYFDNSVFDFYTAIFNGAKLTPIIKRLLTQPLELINYIDRKKCTIWFSVPSMLIYMLTMKVLSKERLNNIRIFTFGGEGFPKTELKKLFDLYNHQSEFINVYGPTECTCICSSYTITKKDFVDLQSLPSLGTINPNFSYVILDGEKISHEGELCLLGPNVGKGYYNDSRTEKVFSLYEDSNHYKKRMYRTGDWVKEEEGLLYFKGRVDNQIKHMGYRIELEEIEGVLNSLPEIKVSAVIYKRVEVAYGKIFAFIVPEGDSLEIEKVKEQLKNKLPTYMLPGGYECLDTLPKNSNGKIDKRQLIERL